MARAVSLSWLARSASRSSTSRRFSGSGSIDAMRSSTSHSARPSFSVSRISRSKRAAASAASGGASAVASTPARVAFARRASPPRRSISPSCALALAFTAGSFTVASTRCSALAASTKRACLPASATYRSRRSSSVPSMARACSKASMAPLSSPIRSLLRIPSRASRVARFGPRVFSSSIVSQRAMSWGVPDDSVRLRERRRRATRQALDDQELLRDPPRLLVGRIERQELLDVRHGALGLVQARLVELHDARQQLLARRLRGGRIGGERLLVQAHDVAQSVALHVERLEAGARRPRHPARGAARAAAGR